MEPNEILTERIEAFLAKTLSPMEQTAFEREMQSDAMLKAEVERHRRAMIALRYGIQVSLKEKLRAIDAEKPGHMPQTKTRSLLRRIAVAAGFLLILAAAAHVYFHQTYTPDKLASRMFAVTEAEEFRGDQPDPNSVNYKMLQAQELFHADRYADAARIFREIANSDSFLREQAEWNMTLSLFAGDPSSRAFSDALQGILSNPEHAYSHDAMKLQKTIQGILYRTVN